MRCEPTPPGIDPTVATAARMYDYFLGGHDNFAADRIAALQVIQAAPDVPAVARANRAFLGRAVRYLAADAGITQFIDLGTGLPTKGNVYQVAQHINPDATVIYVDNDPMVLAHSRALKTGPRTAVIHADIRDPGTILHHPDTQELIDFTQPVAVMLIAVLHFLSTADNPHALVRAYLDAAAPGSYLALSHVATDPNPQQAASVTAVYASTASPATPRGHADILAFFDGLDLVDPGLVPVSQWRPDEPGPLDLRQGWILGGVGHQHAPGLQ